MNHAFQSRKSRREEALISDSKRSEPPPVGSYKPGLHRFTLLLAFVTLALLAAGGLVTSRGVGMAVPDWPNTYGYNMFAFPPSKWLGGIFYEHTHRLVASFVGLLTTILAAWLWIRETTRIKPKYSGCSEPLPHSPKWLKLLLKPILAAWLWVREKSSTERWLGLGAIVLVLGLMGVRRLPVYIVLASCAPLIIVFSLFRINREPKSLRWWGIIAFAVVILQGVLGGLRVVWFKDEIGIFHAALAQLFFVLICALAVITSSWWQKNLVARPSSLNPNPNPNLNPPRAPTTNLLLTISLLIFAQLLLGATMRHQHAGLAIPDFPLAYGKLWPAMDPDSVLRYNQQRIETLAANPITSFQIALQMTHRFVAASILAAVAFCAWSTRRNLGPRHLLSKLSLAWVGLICVQALLGAATIWSNKAADIATAHVIIGAMSLALGSMLWLISLKLQVASCKLQVETPTTSEHNLQAATCNLQPTTP